MAIIFFFQTALLLFLATLFLCLGVFGFILPWSSSFQLFFLSFLYDHAFFFSFLHLILFLMGLSSIGWVFLRRRRKKLTIPLNQEGTSISSNIIQHYLQSYWRTLFPDEAIFFDFSLQKEILFIWAELESTYQPEQEILAERIQRDLEEIFTEVIGFHKKIVLSLSFPVACES